jgi:MFS family permease
MTSTQTARGSKALAIQVTAITFLALLVSAGLRSAPGVMMVPLGLHFGWDRATVSLTSAIGIFLYGLVGPFAAALMLSIGIRCTMMGGLALMAAGTLASHWMSQSWHYLLTWGVISGFGSGAVANVLGATVTNRWFAKRQGLVMGLFSASTATGSLVFLPFLAWLTRDGAWQPVVDTVGLASLIMIPLVLLLLPESPASRGIARFGEAPGTPRRLRVRRARCWRWRLWPVPANRAPSGCCSAPFSSAERPPTASSARISSPIAATMASRPSRRRACSPPWVFSICSAPPPQAG